MEGTSLDHSEQTYTDQKGDSYWRIARKFGTTVDGLLALNGLKKTDVLKIGQTLKVHKATSFIKA
ncbi:LysM domain-containing protein, partial [Klebsiella pneumoniae]|uniref:LysM peptidoglycan-binding domain-containing protein n=1 Tax=Klebsiella pneumoniae TaxID=573 RepID=UPI003A80D9B0